MYTWKANENVCVWRKECPSWFNTVGVGGDRWWLVVFGGGGGGDEVKGGGVNQKSNEKKKQILNKL